MPCTTLIKKLKKSMKMKFLIKKENQWNNTKILAKNTNWHIETQLSGKFENIGESAIEKQNKKEFKLKFFIKSFSSFAKLPHHVKPILLLQWKLHVFGKTTPNFK